MERHLLWFSLIHSLPPVTTRWLARKTQATHAHNSATYTERAHHTHSHSRSHTRSHTHTHTLAPTQHSHATILTPIPLFPRSHTQPSLELGQSSTARLGSIRYRSRRQTVVKRPRVCCSLLPSHPRSRSPPCAACAACRRERCTTASKNSNRGTPCLP